MSDELREALKAAERRFWREEREWAKAGSGMTRDQQTGGSMVFSWLADPSGGGVDFAPLLRALAATSPAATAGLDAAWAEAEAALPDGWRLKEVRLHDDGSAWSAEAENTTGVGRYRRVEQGPTPAAALRALAAKLRERGDDR